MSVAAVFAAAVMMLMLNAFIIVLSNLNVALSALEQKINLIAYVRDSVPPADAERLVERLRAHPDAVEARYVSRDEAMTRLKQQLSDRADLLDMVTGNPLPASVEIRLRDPARIAGFTAFLRGDSSIEDVSVQQDVVDNLVKLSRYARFAGLVMVAGLLGITLFVIINTIRLAVYSRRQEIEIMKLVGATDWFIRWPFVLEGVLYGLIGAVIAVVIVDVSYHPIQYQFLSLVQFLPINPDPTFPLKLGILTTIAGIAVGASGSYISVRRFLDI